MKETVTAAVTDESLLAFEASVEHHYASNDGVRIHYAAAGAGPLLVFLHGFPDHWLGWWPLMAEFRRDHRVVALDMRGYNLSDKPGELQAYAVRHLVDDVRAVIAHAGGASASGASATVVGHDWGGYVAWQTAMDAADVVDRLVVLNMPHPWAVAREVATNPLQRKASEYIRLFLQPLSHTQIPLARLSAWVKEPAYKSRQDVAMAASSIEGMLNYYRANWPEEPYRERLDVAPRIKAPTLLLHGLDDPYVLPAGLNDAWQWVDNEVTIQTFPGEGHFIQHDCPERVAKAMRNWLAAC